MLIRWAVCLATSLVLFSGVSCDAHEKFFSGNLLDKENTFLESEFFGSESHASNQRVLRAVPSGWVSVSTTSLKLIKGETGSVTCSSDTSDLVWMDKSEKKLKTSDNVWIETEKKKTESKLTFKSVKDKNAGLYKCVNPKSNRSANFTLTVYEKPKPTIFGSKSYEFGDNFDLICESKSPNISWSSSISNPILPSQIGRNPVFTGQIMATKKKYTLALSFKNASIAQSGEYKCTARTLNKEKSESISISVYPPTLKFSPEKEEKSVKENDDYSLTCSGKVTQIRWTFQGKWIGSNHAGDENVYVEMKRGDEQKLIFENVEKYNEGEYVCHGNSSFNGEPLKKHFKLKVIEDNLLANPIIRSRTPPMADNIALVKIHSNFTARCAGDTADIQWFGPPHYWQIPEATIPGDNNIYTEHVPLFKKRLLLRFKNVTLADEGKYRCQVKKNGKTQTSEFNLTVTIPIEFENTPSHYSANETGNITLECIANGRPKPQVVWHRHKQPITNETGMSYQGDSLVLTNITYRHAGKYFCVAGQSSIKGETRERAVHVQVLHKPYFSEVNKTIERLKNETSFIKCEADADPAARYTLYRNDSVVTTLSGSSAINLENGTIELPLLTDNDYEVFFCNASNSYGSQVQMINVTVMQPPAVPIVELLNRSENVITITITADRNESITEYIIEYREKSSNEWNETSETKPDSYPHAFSISDLHRKTEYLIRVKSVNPVGISELSSELSVTTSLANQLISSIGILFAVILTLYNFEFL